MREVAVAVLSCQQGILGTASVPAMYLGDGGMWTMIGARLFLLALAWFTQLPLGAAGKQQANEYYYHVVAAQDVKRAVVVGALPAQD